MTKMAEQTKFMGQKALLGVSLALCLFAGGAAVAQSANMVQIEADEIEYAPETGQATLRGDAVVVQGAMVLRSNVLHVFYRGNSQQIDRVVADSEVFLSRGEQRVRGDRGVLNAANNTMTISGHVVVTQGRNVLQGSELTVNTRTNASTMRGLDGRVRAVFFQGGN